MPKVITNKEFRIRSGKHVKDLRDEGSYLVVANEVYADRSFVVLSLSYFKDLLRRAGFLKVAGDIAMVESEISDKISLKYKLLRSKRDE